MYIFSISRALIFLVFLSASCSFPFPSFAYLSFMPPTQSLTRPLISFDEQLHDSDGAHELSWLPTNVQFPAGKVFIILSTLPARCLERARSLGAVQIEVPLLQYSDQAALVRGLLGKYHKKLTEDDSDRFLGNQVRIKKTSIFLPFLSSTSSAVYFFLSSPTFPFLPPSLFLYIYCT